MPEIYGPILPLQLDPRNTPALVRDTQTKIFLESDGQLNDFSPSSPLSAIVEGQAYAQNELLYYLNNLPEAYTLQWLRQLGIQRSIGAKAIAEVTFVKTQGFTRTVVIPKGTIVSTASELKFVLKSEVRIGDSESQEKGIVESERWGTAYNVNAGAIEKINVNILGLDGVTNFTSALGGRDLDSIETMKAKAFSLLRRRGLISAEDYYNEVLTIVPSDSIVKVLTYEEVNNISNAPTGNIFIVAGDKNAESFSSETRKEIIQTLKKKAPIGVSPALLSPEVCPVEVTVSCEYDSTEYESGVDLYAASINNLLKDVISPSNIELGGIFNYQFIYNAIYSLDFVSKINTLSIKVLQLEEQGTDALTNCNAPFVSTTINGTCIDSSEIIVDSPTTTYANENKIKTYRSYKNIISIVASETQSPLTYTFVDSEYDSMLRS